MNKRGQDGAHLEITRISARELRLEVRRTPDRVWQRELSECLASLEVAEVALEPWGAVVTFTSPLSDEVYASLEEDLARYIQPPLRARSLFDIVGPAMVGPSSSHTAGACRAGLLGRDFLEELVREGGAEAIHQVRVRLLGSLRDTGVGHHTPEALQGGLLGLGPDDPDLIRLGGSATSVPLVGRVIPLGRLEAGDAEDDAFYADEDCQNIAEIIVDTDSGERSITLFSVGSGNVELRFRDRRPVAVTPPAGGGVGGLEFNSMEDLLECWGEELPVGEALERALAVEATMSGERPAAARGRAVGLWRVMSGAILRGLAHEGRSEADLSGGDAAALTRAVVRGAVPDSIHTRALRYALAVCEENARGGLVVACPTGGAGGLLPGVLRAWVDDPGRDLEQAELEEAVAQAILLAGFLGMILFDDVRTAGADLGCQAEVGGGAAMAASALVVLEQGTLGQAVQAFTLALKNCMGLICDPVGGLVEVPCIKRNGLFSSVAISAAHMALAGIRSAISPDEVLLAVREVGQRMHQDYKETARAGLARTRDGKRVAALLRQRTDQRFRG